MCTAVSVQGRAKEIDAESAPTLFDKTRTWLRFIPTNASRRADGFQGSIRNREWFDLSSRPIERANFSFGGVPEKRTDTL